MRDYIASHMSCAHDVCSDSLTWYEACHLCSELDFRARDSSYLPIAGNINIFDRYITDVFVQFIAVAMLAHVGSIVQVCESGGPSREQSIAHDPASELHSVEHFRRDHCCLY